MAQALRLQLAMGGAAALLAACVVGPDFKRPQAPADSSYGSATSQGDTAASDAAGGQAQRLSAATEVKADWWTLFGSELLNGLVQQALKNSPDLEAAKAALRQSHELYSAQWTAYLPSLQGGFQGTRNKTPLGTVTPVTTSSNAYYSLYTAQLTLDWAPDLFGLNRRQMEAAQATVDLQRYQFEAARLSLVSNVVVTVVAEASLRGQIAATQRLLDIEHQLTETVRQQRGIGTASQLDLLQQQAAEAQTAQALPPLQKQLGQSRDALTALLGRLPAEEPEETFTLDELSLPLDLPVSLPSQLVQQRPDVREAEASMHVASAQVGVAVANLFPQFDISGNLGSSALQLHNLFTPYTGFWTLGASLTQTLFDAGELLHRRRAADAALDQAAAQYRSAVILACQNVADSLRALQSDADALKASAEAARAADASLDLARRQQKLGTIAMVAVLNAEQTALQARVTLVQAQASRYSDTAGLFQALGGGRWSESEGEGTK